MPQQYENDQQLLPVFVFPNQLTFYLRDPQSHRQIMTIYNPYDFPVSYEVLSTAPNNYSVQEPQGVLKPRCCIDIAIRRIELKQKGTDEKFRVILRRRSGRSDAQGYRDVPSLVFDYRSEAGDQPSSSMDSGQMSGFRGFLSTSAGSPGIAERHGSSSSSIHGTSNYQYPLPNVGRSGRPSWLLAIVAVLCIVCLSAPTIGDGHHQKQENERQGGFSAYFPEWFHLGLSQKLVAAYVLGLITAAFLQS